MAKARSTPRKKNASTPLLPEPVAAFLKRRLWEGLGLALIITSALCLVALISYDSGDPSFNTGTGGDVPVQNFLGKPGAYVADGLLQSLGMTAGFIPVILAIWGFQVASAKYWISRWREFLFLLFGLSLFASFMAIIP